jgi:hypothetical protein
MEMHNIQSHNTSFTVVHPLLGYVHKDLALKLFYYVSAIYHAARVYSLGSYNLNRLPDPCEAD